jgi:hypothetical protein
MKLGQETIRNAFVLLYYAVRTLYAWNVFMTPYAG